MRAALGGAIVMDLALINRVDIDEHHLFLVNSKSVGELAFDGALSRIVADGERRSTDYLVNAFADEFETLWDRLVDRLVDRGILARDRTGQVLVMGERHYMKPDGPAYRDVTRRLAGVLMNDERPDPQDVMIISLAETCSLWRGLVDESALDQCVPQIQKIATMDLNGQSVARVLDMRKS